MKLGIFSNQDFIEAINTLIEIDLPARVSFKVSSIHRELSSENEKFEKGRREIISKYAAKNEDGEIEFTEGSNVRIAEEDLEKFNEELNELSMTDFTVGRISVDELGEIPLPPKLFSLLSEIIIL